MEPLADARKLAQVSRTWDAFDFNALLDSSVNQSLAVSTRFPPVARMSDILHQKATLSLAVLLHNLARRALRLGMVQLSLEVQSIRQL